MEEKEFNPGDVSLQVLVRDAAVAMAVMGIVYQGSGTTGLLILVYAFSLCVVFLLLLSLALSLSDPGNDD